MNAIACNSLSARPTVRERPRAAVEGGVRVNYGRDEEVLGEGEAGRYVYKVISGAVRTYRGLADGRRQIVEFHTAGDVFGLDGEFGHGLGAEAVRATTLQVMRRDAFLHEQGSDAAINALLEKLQRVQAHILLLCRHTACERVAAFLLDFRERAGADVFDLPMSRQDIADYLGVTIETVSRCFTQLQAARLIDLASCRRVVLRDADALKRICK